jgi:hypothetical protein
VTPTSLSHADPSGASARTLLAWSRTAVTAFTLGAVALRLLPADNGGRWVAGALAWTIAIAAESYGYRSYRDAVTIRARRRAAFVLASSTALLAATVAVCVVV